MKQRISPFQFTDHRVLIRELLKEKGYTYRTFVERHPGIVSMDLLKSALTKGLGGTKNKPRREFSPLTLARLGKALKLSDEEVSYLLLLLWETNSEVLPGPYGSAYSDCLKKMISDHKAKQFLPPTRGKSEKAQYTPTAYTVAQLLDSLPGSSRLMLTKGILRESKVVQARQRHKAGVKSVSSVIESLGELLAQGAP